MVQLVLAVPMLQIYMEKITSLGELYSCFSHSSQAPFICKHMLLQWQQEHTLKNQDAYIQSLLLLLCSLLVKKCVPPQMSAFTSHLAPFSTSFSCLDESMSAANINVSLAVLSLPALVLKIIGHTGY